MSGQVPSEGLPAAIPALASDFAKKCASTGTRAARSLVQRSIMPDILSPAFVEPTRKVGGGTGVVAAGSAEPQINAMKSGRLETFSTESVASALASTWLLYAASA